MNQNRKIAMELMQRMEIEKQANIFEYLQRAKQKADLFKDIFERVDKFNQVRPDQFINHEKDIMNRLNDPNFRYYSSPFDYGNLLGY